MEFVNPYDKGVTYAEFVKAKGRLSVANYCKGKLTKEQIDWINTEVKNYKKNKK